MRAERDLDSTENNRPRDQRDDVHRRGSCCDRKNSNNGRGSRTRAIETTKEERRLEPTKVVVRLESIGQEVDETIGLDQDRLWS